EPVAGTADWVDPVGDKSAIIRCVNAAPRRVPGPSLIGDADMSNSRATTQSLRFAAVALFTISAGAVYSQIAAPTNSLPDPYRSVENWAKMPQGRTWGSTAGVAIDPDGASVWVAERCGANSCAGSDLAPVLKFDASGKLVKSFGAGMFVFPHGIF